jgi:hypothetical protein
VVYLGEIYIEVAMNNFYEFIRAWETFYLLVGTAAATLIGLLFIAISIHISAFHQQKAKLIHHYAALTFNCFFYVLLIAIVFLIPNLSPLSLGIPLALLGGLGLANAILQRYRARDEIKIANKFTLPIIGLSGLFVIGILILFRIYPSIYGLVPVILIFLMSSTLNAWTLLIYTEDRNDLVVDKE